MTISILRYLSLFLLLLGTLSCRGATVTVRQSGGGDYTSIAAAVAATGLNDTILVTEPVNFSEAFAVTNRNLVSVPPGAVISNAVTVTGDQSSSTSITGFKFQDAPDGIRFFGDGPDHTAGIGVLNVIGCTFADIGFNGILLNLGNDGTLNVDGCTFTNCGQNGLTLLRNCRATITNSTFESNGLGGNGNAGIFVDGDISNAVGRDLTLTNASLKNNLNGIKSWRRVRLIGTSVTLSSNYLQGLAVDGQSGGSVLVLTKSEVDANNDRGISLHRGMTLSLDETAVTNNGSYGIFLEDMGEGGDSGSPVLVAISKSVIADNLARGFTYVAKGTAVSIVLVADSLFRGTADRLFSCQGGTAKIRYLLDRNIFRTPNSAAIPLFAWHSDAQSHLAANLVDGGAVGVAISEGPISVFNNTIVNAGAGGLVVSNNSGGHLMDIRNNIVAQAGSGIRAAGDGTGFGMVSVDYNLVSTAGTGAGIDAAFAVGGNNKVGEAPQFVGGSTTVGAGDYHLGLGSGARNAGDPARVPVTDLDGHTYSPVSPDLGAYTSTSEISDWRLY